MGSIIPAAAAAAAELSSRSAPSQFPVCLCVWSSRAERARLKGTQTPCRIGGAMGRDRRVNEISVIKEASGALGARGPGAARARRAAHGEAVTHAPHPLRDTPCASSKHFCASSWDSCQMPDRNQSARWPNAAPREAQVPCSNLSGAPELEVSAARSYSAGGNNRPQPWCQKVQLLGSLQHQRLILPPGRWSPGGAEVWIMGISAVF